ncbi:phosphatidate cytidylyltransferase [Candidatus Endobugula sertula]|uniref:Phosphatidate cytidylyltransferase n=1 Tax=Candidatus Endobugula sertula TaxID=62101 RepID=A0A1D2QQU1_9GAMM|nr:phosphatidate cytidylyltransferase [Candidatus Endobugula sertula]
MLKKRIMTALCIFSAFLLCLLLLPAVWFSVIIELTLLVAAWEWANLSGFQHYRQRVAYCIFFALLLALLTFYLDLLVGTQLNHPKLLSILLLSGTWWAIALLWVQNYPASSVLWGNRWVRGAIGFLVLIPSALALVFLNNQPQGTWLILFVVIVVATADTGAYFSGKAFGRHKLAKEVSPGKSWEGFWGGLMSCVLLTVVVALVTDFASWPTLLAIVLPTALVSVLGDLLESMIKRHRGIKDSGKILPGHGGVLDRIDGLTAAAPVFALAIIISDWQFTQ